MLVISRQRDESIIIGDNIVITIVDIRGDKVRLGINAPTEIPVHRMEVHRAINRENFRNGAIPEEEFFRLGGTPDEVLTIKADSNYVPYTEEGEKT